jgi:hypothetical protein
MHVGEVFVVRREIRTRASKLLIREVNDRQGLRTRVAHSHQMSALQLPVPSFCLITTLTNEITIIGFTG